MISRNLLSVEAYSSGNTRIAAAADDLLYAEGITYSTYFPGGLYGDASFFCPRDVLRYWAVRGAKRIVFRNGSRIAYEGYVDGLSVIASRDKEGMYVPLIGAWGHIMMRRRIRKRWADTRVTDDPWQWRKYTLAAEKCTLDRYGRIRFTPKAVKWDNNEYAAVRYTMPTGQTAKRITFKSDLQAGSQAWGIFVLNLATSTYEFSRTTSGADASLQDVTFATPTQSIEIRFYSLADNQTPPSDGTIYGEITELTVYSETGNINLTEIAKDVRGLLTELNASEQYIGSNTFSLVPFIADDFDTAADILINAARFGDASFNQWGAQLLESETVASPDGKPVLSVLQYPALTDYDYVLSFADDNLPEGLSIELDYGDIRNWIIVRYSDEQGRTQYLTPDNNSALKDAASISAWGQRDYVYDIGPATSTIALNNGRRMLAAYKDPRWVMNRPIAVSEFIRAKGGEEVPASLVKAGKRVKIMDYASAIDGIEPVFLISATNYDDASEIVQIASGPVDELVMHPYSHPVIAPPDPVPDSDSSAASSAAPARTNWKRKLGLKPGTPEWEEASKFKGDSPARRAWIEEYKKRKKKGKP